ncbi:MAG TPA: flagellar export chaperone FliS [Longimicrobiales bacterium]|jgi:flagellar protein FliS
MRRNGAASAYLEARILGSTKEQLVPVLYEQILANLRRASEQIAARDLVSKGESFSRASALILELLSALDFEAGGELASRLSALYAYFLNEINAISRTLDTERLERLIEMVATLHQAWVEAAEKVRGAGGGPEVGRRAP